jgi:LysM repeat protein
MPLLVAIVVVAHCVAVGSVILIQGCGTTVMPVMPPPEPVMPPAETTDITPVLPPPSPVVAPPAKTWPAETTMYTVRKGDSLSTIAGRYGLSVAEIVAVNGIKNPDMIRVGQRLILPGKVDVKAAPPPSKPARPAPGAEGDVYTVVAGDSLSVIAHRFGTTVNALRKANGLSGDKIIVGQKLAIPGAAKKPAPEEEATEFPRLDLDVEPAGLEPGGPQEGGVEAPEGAEEAPALLPLEGGEPETKVPSNVRIHVVEADEDLYSVAMMWGVSVNKLKEVNDLSDTALTPGQRLKIPLSE